MGMEGLLILYFAGLQGLGFKVWGFGFGVQG